ncbi:MAG: EcsC family protein [Candidatus Helarchaeota archaeon]|nr:EcsC family protein [Candidatus Helarchaeota archaeon]
MADKPSKYELQAIKEIHVWKSGKISRFSKTMEFINWPIKKAIDPITGVPWVGWVIEKSIKGIISALNDLALWTVRPEAIYKKFSKFGINVQKRLDIFNLDLEQVDRVIGWLGAKYKGTTMGEGGTFGGFFTILGIVPDILALVTMNQRAIGQYATYCGFDISTQHERLFAMNVLGLASSPTDASKQYAMAQLVRIAKDVAKKKAWRDLEKHAFVKITRKIAESLGIRLTKAKLAQIIPILGAGVGAAFNGYYTNKVCNAAYYLYRERFLAEKYGPDIIEITVKLADDYTPDYRDD